MSQAVFKRENGVLTYADGTAFGDVASATDLPFLLQGLGVANPLIVSGGGLSRSGVVREMARHRMPFVHFNGFTPNPTAEQVQAGLQAFREGECDGIVSIGGGSAIDVAKAIKAMGATDVSLPVLERLTHPMPLAVPHVAMPTTAGTGSEATHFATIYINGKKYSVADAALLPEAAILDAAQLASLPVYERSATFMDALCHSIESYWSVRSSEESRAYARQAIQILVSSGDDYLAGDEAVAEAVLAASHLAGRAINLTTTTAAHAMCYQLTSLYGLSHGHAAAECLPAAWQMLLRAAESDAALHERLTSLAGILQGQESADADSGLAAFMAIKEQAKLPADWRPRDDSDIPLLASSVNVQRLSNFPMTLSEADLITMYRVILG